MNDIICRKCPKHKLEDSSIKALLQVSSLQLRRMGSSHVVPIWFVLEYRNDENNLGNIYFTTFIGSVKAENIQRDNRISICIDDQTPPFTFVTIHGTAKLYSYRQKEILKWATRIAKRYMGKKESKAYGERNSGEGAVLVQIKPTKIIAEKDIPAWE